MDDTFISIIAVIVASIIMFIFPFVILADRNDDIAQLTVETLTEEFVDSVIKTGKITSEDYQKFILRLDASRNTYDINIEVKILDENPSKKVTDDTGTSLGVNTYYSIFTSQIEEKFVVPDSKIILKEGDEIFVTVKNNSKTLSQTLKSLYYTIRGEDLHIISGTSSGTIAVNGVS